MEEVIKAKNIKCKDTILYDGYPKYVETLYVDYMVYVKFSECGIRIAFNLEEDVIKIQGV